MDSVLNQKVFKNPNKKPLNELFFEYKIINKVAKNDVPLEEMLDNAEKPTDVAKWNKRYQVKTEKMPALDKCWLLENRRIVEFHPYYIQFSDEENIEFMDSNREFLNMLEYFSSCTFHLFWCYVAFEERFSYVLNNFLEHAIPPHGFSYVGRNYKELYKEIYSCVNRIYERLFTFKLSETEFIDEKVAIEYLRKAQLLSVRSIFLICYLCNFSNPKLVKKIVVVNFKDKPNETTTKELTEVLTDVMQDFDKLESLELLPPISTCSVLRRIPDHFDPIWLEDVSFYVLEMTTSLLEFVTAYKPSIEILFELALPHRMSHIYQKIYLKIQEVLQKKEEIGYDCSRLETLADAWVAKGRVEFLNLFHVFTGYIHDKILEYKEERAEQEMFIEMYLGMISNALDDDLFTRDYNKIYPLQNQFQLLVDNVTNFDKTQTDYLLHSLSKVVTETTANNEKEETFTADKTSNVYNDENRIESIYDTLTQYLEVQQTCDAIAGTSSGKHLPEPVLIALQQYGQLMKVYDSSPNVVPKHEHNVNRPSEDQIEQHIKAVREMLPDLEPSYILRCLELMDFKPEQVISRILDNDLPIELLEIPKDTDTFAQAGPSKEVKIVAYTGKKPDYKDANALLDDRKEKQSIKNLILNSSFAYDLDDDYDDRNDVRATFEEDENKIYRHLKQPELDYNAVSDPSSSSSEEEKLDDKPKDAFCENPEVVRARREARNRGFRPPNKNVGKPKDQEQTKEVKQNRDKKNIHKSVRANHNRKGGAQWKRSRGMI